MVNSKNLLVLNGRLVDEPDLVNDGKIAKMRLACDWSGKDDAGSKTGFFSVTYFKGSNPNSDFVFGQIEAQNFKKGTGISLVGRLHQDRWEKDGTKNSQIIVIAESIDYANDRPPADESTDQEAKASAVPESF